MPKFFSVAPGRKYRIRPGDVDARLNYTEVRVIAFVAKGERIFLNGRTWRNDYGDRWRVELLDKGVWDGDEILVPETSLMYCERQQAQL